MVTSHRLPKYCRFEIKVNPADKLMWVLLGVRVHMLLCVCARMCMGGLDSQTCGLEVKSVIRLLLWRPLLGVTS